MWLVGRFRVLIAWLVEGDGRDPSVASLWLEGRNPSICPASRHSAGSKQQLPVLHFLMMILTVVETRANLQIAS